MDLVLIQFNRVLMIISGSCTWQYPDTFNYLETKIYSALLNLFCGLHLSWNFDSSSENNYHEIPSILCLNSLWQMCQTFTNAQTEMSAPYASFESKHIFLKTNKRKPQYQTNKKTPHKKKNLIQNYFLFNISEGEDYLFHGYLLSDTKTE